MPYTVHNVRPGEIYAVSFQGVVWKAQLLGRCTKNGHRSEHGQLLLFAPQWAFDSVPREMPGTFEVWPDEVIDTWEGFHAEHAAEIRSDEEAIHHALETARFVAALKERVPAFRITIAGSQALVDLHTLGLLVRAATGIKPTLPLQDEEDGPSEAELRAYADRLKARLAAEGMDPDLLTIRGFLLQNPAAGPAIEALKRIEARLPDAPAGARGVS